MSHGMGGCGLTPNIISQISNFHQGGHDIYDHPIEIPIDSGMGLSIDKRRLFINKTLSTQSLINQLLIKRVGLSISIDSQ